MTYYDIPGVKPGPFPGEIEKRKLPFSSDEYDRRLGAVQEKMTATGVDAFVVTDPSNICYLSGYAAASAYVAQGLLFFRGEKFPHFYLRRQDAPAAMYMTVIPNDRIHGYPERYIGDYSVSGFDVVMDAVQRHGDVKAVGLEYGATSARAVETIRERFKEFSYKDLSEEIDRLRLIKSAEERVYLREAGKLTQSVALRLGEWFQPGRPESDVAGDVMAALTRGLPGQPGEPTEYLLMPGGKQSGTSHITWTEQNVELGKHYNVEFAGARHRYHAPIMRTVSIGAPSDKLRRMHDYMVEGCNEALAVAAPGRTCADVARAFCAVMDKGGYWKDSRCGYPIGINWLETVCSLRVDDPTVLQEGMAFHLMLGVWLEEDFGAIVSESFLVTKTGVEVLNDVPREIIVV